MDSRQILEILTSQRFETFFHGVFLEFISGSKDALTQEEILERIKRLFNLEK